MYVHDRVPNCGHLFLTQNSTTMKKLPKLEILCGNDPLRPAFEFIEFSADGYCVCTNAHVFARWRYDHMIDVDSAHHGKFFLGSDEPPKYLHAEQWRTIRTIKALFYNIGIDGLSVATKNGMILFRWVELVDFDFPKWRTADIFENPNKLRPNHWPSLNLDFDYVAKIKACFTDQVPPKSGVIFKPLFDRVLIYPFHEGGGDWCCVQMAMDRGTSFREPETAHFVQK